MRVIGLDGVAQGVTGEVGINLRGGDTFVSQHLLHGTEVGTVLHQFGGETVTEGMGTHMLANASVGNGLFQKHEDIVAREVRPAAVEENILLLVGLRFDVRADGVNIGGQHLEGMGVDGHPAFFAALTEDLKHSLVGIDI